MKFPVIVVASAMLDPLWSKIPAAVELAITLQGPVHDPGVGCVPPTMVPVAGSPSLGPRSLIASALGADVVPSALTPIRLPWIVLLSPATAIASLLALANTFASPPVGPPIVEPSPFRLTPVTIPSLAPEMSTPNQLFSMVKLWLALLSESTLAALPRAR